MNAKIISTKDFEKRAYNLFFERVKQGDYIGALGIMHARYKKDPKDKAVIKNLADVYSQMEEYARALFFRFKLLSLTSKENRLLVYKDIVLDVDALDNVVLTNFYLNKIFAEFGREGMYQVAGELSDRLTQKFKFEPFFVAYPPNQKYYNRILSYGKQAINSFSASAGKSFFEKVPLDSFDDASVKDYATAYMLDEDYEGAIKLLKEFLAIKGEKTYIYAYIAIAYNYLENAEKLEYYLEKALSVFDGSEEEALDLYELIKDLKQTKRFLKVYEKLSKVYKYNAQYHYDYAVLLKIINEIDRAKEEISLARKIEPDNATFYLEEQKIYSNYNTEIEEKKNFKNVKFEEKVKYYESFLRVKDSVTAKGVVYTLVEKGTLSAMRVLDDALIDLEVSNEIKHTIVYAKIAFGYLDRIFAVIDGRYYEIKPKKLSQEAQKSNFYTAVYALSVSKTFESLLCSETALKNAVNKVYKTFKDKFDGDDDLRDVTTTVCILALKGVEKSELINSFSANEKKVNKYLEIIKGQNND